MTCPGGCIGGGGQPRFTDNQRPPGPHRRHLPRGRGQEAPQVAREPRRRPALRRVPRPAAGREVAPPAAHQVHAARADVRPSPSPPGESWGEGVLRWAKMLTPTNRPLPINRPTPLVHRNRLRNSGYRSPLAYLCRFISFLVSYSAQDGVAVDWGALSHSGFPWKARIVLWVDGWRAKLSPMTWRSERMRRRDVRALGDVSPVAAGITADVEDGIVDGPHRPVDAGITQVVGRPVVEPIHLAVVTRRRRSRGLRRGGRRRRSGAARGRLGRPGDRRLGDGDRCHLLVAGPLRVEHPLVVDRDPPALVGVLRGRGRDLQRQAVANNEVLLLAQGRTAAASCRSPRSEQTSSRQFCFACALSNRPR